MAGEDDPYAVLGLSEGTDFETVSRVYKQKLYEANRDGNEELKSRIEAAHSTLMMRSLMNRSAGKVTVPKEIAKADRQVLFPWRPRLQPCERSGIAARAALALGCIAYTASIATSGSYAFIATILAFSVANYFKLSNLFPAPAASYGANPEQRKVILRNLVRSAGLSAGSAVSGMALFYTVPDALGILPAAVTRAQWMYIVTCSALLCFVVSAFYR
ncbi:unnamed protein product [Pedinophyceae sp. YPF-701]|nr:unnamed protein product [Pedinophyceae sp. YPF-701]